MKITIVIPTYRRVSDLINCLQALQTQIRPADQVIVVVRDTDNQTWDFLQGFNSQDLPLQTVTVKVPGVVAAMNAGLDAATGDIVAFTDDDSAPHRDWFAKIEDYFLSDSHIGGVGGKDWQYVNGKIKEPGEREIVGKLQWCGRVIGNHHLGVGTVREVDVLKGVNMAFRRSAIAGMHFDERMLGTGAQVHFELAFSLKLKHRGWKLIYDPAIAVDHFPAQRFDEDQRDSFNQLALTNAVHNETLALLEYLSPLRQLVFILWAVFIGTRDAFGLLQVLRLYPKQGNIVWRKWLASLQGRWQGWQTYHEGSKNPELPLLTAEEGLRSKS
ncbi:glycosyltransferase family 2 protein [Calothrix sp. 336/3]|uniref:glycosyltransferase family 2 protein n=1 Tax=Calothrix sp. 336/3 TaxID=1337936 RepID=UPI000624ECEE|nr:glycosyltransferase family 2 protein [Calothrix sp. 336/3]AKG23264.1 glycosyl transferase family A [Calothrix sp. 336/3]